MKRRQPIHIYRAAAIRDASGRDARPGAVAVRDGRVLAAGRYNRLPRRIRQHAQIIDRPEHLLLPAMINAHAHLDLTDIGPVEYGGNFIEWLRRVMSQRPTDPAAITHAVERGLALSREAGVGYVGDIAASTQALHARQNAPGNLRLPGVSYLEVTGIGHAGQQMAQRLEPVLDELTFEAPVPGHVRGSLLGIAPHAPYACGKPLYEAATRLSHEHIYRLSTHLAESEAELEFVRHGTGPFAELLKDLGKWDDAIQPSGQHPIEWLEHCLKRGRWLVAHCNYVHTAHIHILKRTGTSVVYCPIASDYFGHRGHRYQQMLDAGVNVCLGTDSILCQPVAEREPQPLGILPQMRYLYRRDNTAPQRLLEMATTNGRLALEFRDTDSTLRRGAPAVFTAVRIDPDSPTDPLVQILQSHEPAETIHAQHSE